MCSCFLTSSIRTPHQAKSEAAEARAAAAVAAEAQSKLEASAKDQKRNTAAELGKLVKVRTPLCAALLILT